MVSVVGLHVVISFHLHLRLRRRCHPPRPYPHPLPPSPPCPTRANPGHTQPHHDPNLRLYFRRDPPIRRCRNPRHPLVLAEVQNPSPMVAVLSSRHSPIWARILLVVPLLPHSFPSPRSQLLLRSPPPETDGVSTLQTLRFNPHVLSLA